ncbi:MAG: SDR family NAD(P)-dependent oxidoreductase, partial [Bacteroidetes bacterium]|nr:SDR family NAD(P)-dependent oxidoreductase [Bacteroidota bacterium]
MIKAYLINLVAPAVMINNFVNAYQQSPADKIVLNISSGAGKRPVDGWMAYCSTKAGLDLFAEVVAKEQDIAGHSDPIRILSVAPGIVDTQMQSEIRDSKEHDFSRVAEFIDFKEQDHLSTPEAVALKLYKAIKDPDVFKEVIADVRNMS